MDKETLIQKFNSNSLTPQESDKLEALFIANEFDINEIDLFNKFDNTALDASLSQDATLKFQDMLSAEISRQDNKPSQSSWFNLIPLPFKMALASLLLLCAFLIGKSWQSNDTGALSTNKLTVSKELNLMDDLLNNPSAGQRVTMVNNADALDIKKDHIIRILFLTLNHDKSSNVRMAAVDALIPYANQEQVREGLINALTMQTSPIMVEYLAEALRIIGTKIPEEKTKGLKEHLIPKDVLSNSIPTEIY